LSNTDRETSHLLEKLVRLPYTGYNQVELLIDGREIYDSIFAAIDQAQDYVLVQFYIVRDDDIGKDLQKRLIACAARGVRVNFLYDEIGSADLPKSYLRDLRNAGIDAKPFNSTKGESNRFQLNFRNHRKIVVVDGRSAFIGGLN